MVRGCGSQRAADEHVVGARIKNRQGLTIACGARTDSRVVGVGHPNALSPQEMAAAEVAERILGVTTHGGTEEEGMFLTYPEGRRAAFEELTVGDKRELQLAHLRRESDMHWPAPARWWWSVTVNDVRCIPRVRDVFPVAARACEAHGVASPGQLPPMVTVAIPDLHWLVHSAPAHLVGHPEVLDRPATVTLRPGRRAVDEDMTTVVPALEHWLVSDQAAADKLDKLTRRDADEHHLYLTVDYTGLAPGAFDALVRADGIPPQPFQERPSISHLWIAPVLGRRVFLWSPRSGWSRHEPYD